MELPTFSGARRKVDEELARHADDIRDRLGAALRIVNQMTGDPEKCVSSGPVQEKDIRELIKLRRARDRFFSGNIFADPAWDILLELYASELGQLKISVSGLCACAAVPPTTALRWIGALERAGIIFRSDDPTDARRHFLSLTPAASEAMTGYFRIVPRANAMI